MKEQSNAVAAEPTGKKSLAIKSIEALTGLSDFVLQTLPVAVYTCNARGIITSYNDAAASLWGRHPEIGKDVWCGSWKIYTTSGDPMELGECPMAIALREGREVNGEEIIVERPDGKKLNVQPHPRPLFNSDGEVIGAVNMLLDIT